MNKQSEGEDPVILALESATEVSSVAVFRGAQLLGLLEYPNNLRHARLMAPMIATLLRDLKLAPSDLDAVCVAKGPGSYTGLRVGVSTAKGLCMSTGAKLLSIDSMEGLAHQVKTWAYAFNATIIPMIDARRMEVYAGFYDQEIRPLNDIRAEIVTENSFQNFLEKGKVIFLGNGASKCREVLEQHPNAIVCEEYGCSAASLGATAWKKFQKGDFEDLVTFEPFYLKEFVAKTPKKLV